LILTIATFYGSLGSNPATPAPDGPMPGWW